MQVQKWYYCTKTIKFPMSDVVNAIYSLFKKKKTKTISFNNIYEYLKSAFNVKSFNRNNLSNLLGKGVFVSSDTISDLMREHNTEKKGILDFLFDLFLNYPKKVQEIINVFGVDNLIKFCDNEIDILNTLLAKMNLNYRRFDDNDKDICIKWISSYSQEEWHTILCNTSLLEYNLIKIKESLQLEYNQKCFLDDILFCFKDIHKDNYVGRVKYLLPLGNIFNKYGIYKISDIENANLNIAKELYPFKEDILKSLNTLQFSVLANFNIEYGHYVQKVNKKLEPHSLWGKYITILEHRANGETLESSGQCFNVTRERVRQLENDYLDRFELLVKDDIPHCINQIRAFVGDERFIDNKDFRRMFRFNPIIFKYMLQISDIKEVDFIEELDKFYFIDDYDWYKNLVSYSESLPDRINIKDVSSYINKGLSVLRDNGFILSDDDCKKIALKDYKAIGNEYSRYKISLSEKFKNVLINYYPNPIDIYDKKFLAEFRNHFNELYNGESLKTDRATTGVLTRIGMLVGRGLYVLNDHYFMSEKLANKIYDYIIQTKRDIYLTNNIYSLFERELLAEGIDNKYFMQGALKQRIEGKVYFRRDYISLAPNLTSTYGEIYNFIKDAKRIVLYDEIEKEFYGITWNVIQFAVSQEGLLNYRKKYIHYNNLPINESDVEYLRRTVDFFIEDNNIHHMSEIFEFIQEHNNTLLEKLFIENQFGMFSLLEYLFVNKYDFKRPFIARKGIVIDNQGERIREFINSYDEVAIDSVLEFVYDNKLHLYSIVDLVDSLDNYVFKDNKTLVEINNTKLIKENVSKAEEILLNLLANQDFVYADAVDLTKFPVEVKWTPWLLYSAINKFGNNLRAIPSDTKFKFKNLNISRPVIIKKNIPIKVLTEYADYIGNKIQHT